MRERKQDCFACTLVLATGGSKSPFSHRLMHCAECHEVQDSGSGRRYNLCDNIAHHDEAIHPNAPMFAGIPVPRKLREIINHYFKDDGAHTRYMSGLPLPVDADEVVRNIRFIDCTFHPQCGSVKFEGCEFVNCDGVEYLRRSK